MVRSLKARGGRLPKIPRVPWPRSHERGSVTRESSQWVYTAWGRATPPWCAVCRDWGEKVRRAVARLQSDAREAFLLKHVEELEYEDMARLTGAGISALKMRVKRAREQLQAMLKEAERV